MWASIGLEEKLEKTTILIRISIPLEKRVSFQNCKRWNSNKNRETSDIVSCELALVLNLIACYKGVKTYIIDQEES